MEVLIFQKEAFEEMAAKFSRFSDRVNELLAKQGGKSLNRWMDNQEVCQHLNISLRTLQTCFTDRRMCCVLSNLWKTDGQVKALDFLYGH